MKIKFSVIIPFFNRSNTIQRCVDSIGKTISSDIEIIIVDDHSFSPPSITPSDQLQIVCLEKNAGPVAARSFGADVAKGDFFIFLDSDDELVENWREVLETEIAANDCQIFGFPDIMYTAKRRYTITNMDDYWKWSHDPLRSHDYLLVISRVAYESTRMPKMRISEIWYFVLLYRSLQKAIYSDKPLFKYNQDSGNQISKTRDLKFKMSKYERDTVSYTSNLFLLNAKEMRMKSNTLYVAWKRRLIKECLLTLNIGSLIKIVFETYVLN
jgi:glycosyltransferase involved in cell wall biosynthesis